MGNKDEVKDNVEEAPTIDPEQDQAPTHPSEDLMDVWVRERKEALARQLAENAEIKQRWLASNPIEISQRQRGYHANRQVQTSAAVEAKA